MKNVGGEIFRIQDMIHSNSDTNCGQALAAMGARIDTLVDDKWIDPMFFKIGITWNPPYRWANRKYGYSLVGCSHMEILMCDPNSQLIGLYEASLIDKSPSHNKCLNKKVETTTVNTFHRTFFM